MRQSGLLRTAEARPGFALRYDGIYYRGCRVAQLSFYIVTNRTNASVKSRI